MYSRIKQLTGGPRNRSGTAIKKRYGEVAVGIDEVKKRWQEYTEELFDDNRLPFELDVSDWGVPIRRYEMEAAVKQMKKGKAIGEDGVAVEMVEALGSEALMWWCNWQIEYMMQGTFLPQCNCPHLQQYQRSREQWNAISIEL